MKIPEAKHTPKTPLSTQKEIDTTIKEVFYEGKDSYILRDIMKLLAKR